MDPVETLFLKLGQQGFWAVYLLCARRTPISCLLC